MATAARMNLVLLKDCIEMLGLALATDHHVWTPTERRTWERAWVEIRRHQSGDPNDPPVPTHALAHRGHVRRAGHQRPGKDDRATL